MNRAFERLYRRHVATVYRYSLAVLRNPADAEDITQTTFMNAYRAYQRGERPRAPENWLIRIAHNACRQRFRESGRRPQEVPLQEGFDTAVAAGVSRDEVEELLQALGELSFNQRAAIVLREFEGRSYAEIAAMLGLSVRAVETSIFRARRSLRLRRSGLRALGTAPLPVSLHSFGSVGLVDGAAIAGSGIAAKALAVLAVGVVIGGAGFGTVKAVLKPGSVVAADPIGAPGGAAPADRSQPKPGRARRGHEAAATSPLYNHRDAYLLVEQTAVDPTTTVAHVQRHQADPPTASGAEAAPSSPPAQPSEPPHPVTTVVAVGQGALPVNPAKVLPSLPAVAVPELPAPPTTPAVTPPIATDVPAAPIRQP